MTTTTDTDASSPPAAEAAPQPCSLPTPGEFDRELSWRAWQLRQASASALDPVAARILRRLALRADAGRPTRPEHLPPELDADEDVLRALAGDGLATRLGDGSYWPGSLAAAEPAALAQPLLDACLDLLEATDDEAPSGWFAFDHRRVAAAVSAAPGNSPRGRIPHAALDVLRTILVDCGWLEERPDGRCRLTPRALAEGGPAPGPRSMLADPAPTPDALRSLLRTGGRRPGAFDAARRRRRALHAADRRGLSKRDGAVLAELAAAADPVERLCRNELLYVVRPGGRGPRPSVHLVLVLDPPNAPESPAAWAERLAPTLPGTDAAVLRELAAAADPDMLLATVSCRALTRRTGHDHSVVRAALDRLGKRGLVLSFLRPGHRPDDLSRHLLFAAGPRQATAATGNRTAPDTDTRG